MILCAVAMSLCASAFAQGLSGGGGSASIADKKLEVQSEALAQDEIGGTVAEGRSITLYSVQGSASGDDQLAELTANIAILATNGVLKTVNTFQTRSFMSNRTIIVYFVSNAGTNESIHGTDLEFTVTSSDTGGSTSNLWGDVVTFTEAQGYDTNTFQGYRADGQLYPSHVPLSSPSKRIIGAIFLKHLSQTDQPTVDWFTGYVDAFPALQIEVTPKVKGTAYPGLTLTKGGPSLLVDVSTNGVVTLRSEPLANHDSYVVQVNDDIGNASGWQDQGRLAADFIIPVTTTNAVKQFFRLVYRP